MSRVAIAIAAHGLPGLTGILSVPIEGTHSLSLTVVRAYSAAGGGWAVQQGRGHVLATWLAMAGPCCGGRALALRLDRGSGGASKPHPVTQEVVLDACTGHPTGIHESIGPSCRLWALLGGFGGPGEPRCGRLLRPKTLAALSGAKRVGAAAVRRVVYG